MPTRRIRRGAPHVPAICLDPEHNVPAHRVWEPGLWEHECPRCGKRETFAVAPTFYEATK